MVLKDGIIWIKQDICLVHVDNYMTQTELIEMAKNGHRIPRQPLSLFDKVIKKHCKHSNWRAIVCNYNNDVVECSECGKQKVVNCYFDDEID